MIEHKHPGGTCVNVGCMPKKVCYNVSSYLDMQHMMKLHGVDSSGVKFNYKILKKNRDSYVHRLRGVYEKMWKNSNVKYVKGFAEFIEKNKIQVGDEIFEGEKILIATGSKPHMPKIEGIEHCIDSDGFFDMEELPKKVVVVGGGYIAIELAQIMKGLGSQVDLVVRSKILKFMCDDVTDIIMQNMKK